jgi:hypothetical protein
MDRPTSSMIASSRFLSMNISEDEEYDNYDTIMHQRWPSIPNQHFDLFETETSDISTADDETPTSTDTEVTAPDEEECEFKITPAITRRISLLPQTQRKDGPSLDTLASELQLQIFSYLDKIDSTCLGLTSPRAYTIYRAIHGTKMPLNTRRIGPNKLESAWEVIGKQECKQCGVYRCELYQHIKSWMPKDLEYCAFKLNFGTAASNVANATCYRGKPSKPKRCGRHPLRTTSMHQDDTLATSSL